MVKNIPTICIDGKIAFVSQIPPKNELIAAIQKRINEKLKLMIRSKNTEFVILGNDMDECTPVKNNIELALKETGKDINVRVSTDPKEIQSFLVSSTPAVILTEHKVKTQGEVPKVEIVREWLKDL
jgi:hypothetical protein